ncbi:MAG: protein-L-isoaspartate O-methyltransferase [Candidatus Woesebacteria bacterium]|nr:protein-L-isoaspartate O-methyltransferase [Candidatus Woesebacteria bacterium]
MSFLERILAEKRRNLFDGLGEYASPRVIQAMKEIPRTKFVHPINLPRTYNDEVLSIPSVSWLYKRATISQPGVVAEMTELLDPQPNESVLEIGTASGYQAAVLSKLVKNVVSVEIIPGLAKQARRRFKNLGIDNVKVVLADGSIPFTGEKVFDKILVTASVFPHFVPLFMPALKENGVCVLPVGGDGGDERFCKLTRIRRKGKGYFVEKATPGFVFVLMEGAGGWEGLNAAYLDFLHNDFFRLG